MKLIIGLGNPETRYDGTRHNVGFATLDRFAAAHDATFAHKDKFKADIAELIERGDKVLLAKPDTFYNNSGEAVRLLADFYKIEPDDILIVHDELALPLGTVRNNGVKSVTAHVGPDTARIRIGVSNDTRSQQGDVDFVLGKFSQDETKMLADKAEPIEQLIDAFIADDFEPTTHS
jgi:PTH1 family peptidyl-tRNA hydrolase